MKKRRLKKNVKISILTISFIIIFAIAYVISPKSLKTKTVSNIKDDYTFVNDYIFDNYYPVINQEEVLKVPYNSDKVSLYRHYYDKDSNEDVQTKSIIYHDGIYMQNSGIEYKSDDTFDVLSSITGNVSNVSDDELLGKSVEIRNSSEIVTVYQCLGDVLVKKGDSVTQGQVIAKSGTCNLNSDVKNLLHFEIYNNGAVLNPEQYFDKSLKEIINKNKND